MKRLLRSKKDKLVGGVCGGLGDYLAVDPVIVRIVFLILFFFKGVGFIAYILLWAMVPEEGQQKTQQLNVNGEENSFTPKAENSHLQENGAKIVGLILIVLGVIFLLENLNFLDHIFWWIGDIISTLLFPVIFIGIGLILIFRNRNNKLNNDETNSSHSSETSQEKQNNEEEQEQDS